MKTFSSLCLLATVAALALLPVSLELSISLSVAAGIVALLAKDYGRALAPVAARA
jgi:hypothetical protein